MGSRTLNRRKRSPEWRAAVLPACAEPGASVAGVALQHGLNAKLVHKWRRDDARRTGVLPGAGSAVGEFIALPLPAPGAAAPMPDIRIELRRSEPRGSRDARLVRANPAFTHAAA